MKAALNGVPSLSVLDGWWLEGHVEGVTGWAIGSDGPASLEHPAAERRHASRSTTRSSGPCLPLFYHDRERVHRRHAHTRSR